MCNSNLTMLRMMLRMMLISRFKGGPSRYDAQYFDQPALGGRAGDWPLLCCWS